MGARKLREPVAWPATLETLCLYESHLKPGGAEYRELCRFVLGGGQMLYKRAPSSE
jgi:2'-5' RNA ligase